MLVMTNVTGALFNNSVTDDLIIITREGFLRKNIVAVSFFQNYCYTPIFLIHVHIFSIK